MSNASQIEEKAKARTVSLPDFWWPLIDRLSPGNRSKLIQDAVRTVLEREGLLVQDEMSEFLASAQELARDLGPAAARRKLEQLMEERVLSA